MRKTTKLLASLITVLTLFASTSVQANAEWKSDSTGYWYTSGSTYLTGWHSIDGNWYYFYSDGYMAHDCWIEGYYLNSNGAWTTSVPAQIQNTSVNTPSTIDNNDVSSGVIKNASDTVYVSSKGIYHNTANAHGMKNSTAMSRSKAQAAGYKACEAKHCP